MIICLLICTVDGTEIYITSKFRLNIPFVKLFFDYSMQAYDNMHIRCVTEPTTGLNWDFCFHEICLYKHIFLVS
jgi:hypothetical protein